MKPRLRSATTGFTLVEMLVVIVIIVVLAALSFFASRRMVESARNTRSVSNMREVGTLVLTHAADNNGRLPALREFSGDEPGQPMNWHWNQQVAALQYPEVERKTIASDIDWWWRNEPLVKNPRMPKEYFETWYTGYAMNLFIAENHYTRTNSRDWEMMLRHEVPLAALTDPARTPLIVPHWNWHTGDLLSGTRLNDINRSSHFLHNGGMSVVFADGHIESLRFTDEDGEPLAVCEYAERGLDRMPEF